EVSDGETVDLAPYTSEVEVVVEASDLDATVEVVGGSDLSVGENTLVVLVTAANGDVAEYTVVLNVLVSSETGAAIQVNGEDVQDGDVIELAANTSDVQVDVVLVDENASVEVEGDSGLVVGENTLTVTVTAADGESVAVSTFVLMVAANSDTSLATFQVDGVDVAAGDSVELDPYTTEVGLVVETTDPDATFEVVGGSELQPGENVLTVTVTAADGETVEEHTVTLLVALGDDTGLAVFTVDGVEVSDGETVDLAPGTSEVEVVVEPSDPDASVEIAGGADLQPGENSLVVTVTAANGDVLDYNVVLNVLLSSNTELASFQVNGNDVQDGDTVDLEAYTTEVEVVVETSDPDASYEVDGGMDLQSGENTLTVTVTAADGETTATYTVVLNVLLSANTELSVFQVNGNDVQDGDT
ncbi:MAG: hypothetical protein EB038_09185, partial [Cyclobacteriaceae bacterium]|nr:hypothetical protein [Cyclobacteriaceae bacterium]